MFSRQESLISRDLQTQRDLIPAAFSAALGRVFCGLSFALSLFNPEGAHGHISFPVTIKGVRNSSPESAARISASINCCGCISFNRIVLPPWEEFPALTDSRGFAAEEKNRSELKRIYFAHFKGRARRREKAVDKLVSFPIECGRDVLLSAGVLRVGVEITVPSAENQELSNFPSVSSIG